jgi:hypothetical protein
MAKQNVDILEQFGSIMKSEVIEPLENSVEGVVSKWLQGRIDYAKKLLADDNRNTTAMALYDSIRQGQFDLSQEGKISVTVLAEDYWQYINFGVNGTQVNHGSNMSFTTKAPPLSSMLQYIKDKTITELAYTSREGQRIIKPLTTDKARMGAAYVFAQGVKRKGIRKTPFITDSFTDKEIDNLTQLLANIWQSQ